MIYAHICNLFVNGMNKPISLSKESGDTGKLSGCQLACCAESAAAHEKVDDDVEMGVELREHDRAGRQEREHRGGQVAEKATGEGRLLLAL